MATRDGYIALGASSELHRAPADLTSGRSPNDRELDAAISLIDRAGVVPFLEGHVDSTLGRPPRIRLRALLIAAQLNGLARNHQPRVIEIARVINAMTTQQRAKIGIDKWDSRQAYDRVDYRFRRLVVELRPGHPALMGTGVVTLDAQWFGNRLVRASVPRRHRRSRSVAVDSTAIETWGRLRGDPESLDVEGEPPEGADTPPSPLRKKGHRAQPLSIGADGKAVWTADTEARGGWKTATSGQRAHKYVGRALHLIIQARDVSSNGGFQAARIAPAVPQLILGFSLAPANSSSAEAAVPAILELDASGHQIKDVIWDRGYSQATLKSWRYPLMKAGIETTFILKSTQAGEQPFGHPNVRLIDGHPYVVGLPDSLAHLVLPGWGATQAEREASEKQFNIRAAYAYSVHRQADVNGSVRFASPFRTGRLRAKDIPWSLRNPQTTPLVKQGAGCPGTFTVAPDEAPLWQRFLPGTTAHRQSYARRQVVESVNSMLKGGFVDLKRGALRVFGDVENAVMMAFTLVGYNVDRCAALERIAAAGDQAPRLRAKRGRTSLDELLGIVPHPEPPPAR